MHIPAELKYSEEHAWAKREGSKVTIGMTDFAQAELGDIVFVELPETGDRLTAGQPFGSVESVKTVSELYAPVSGTVVAVNRQLIDSPEKVNESPYEDGWMVTVELAEEADWDRLWSAEQYAAAYGTE